MSSLLRTEAAERAAILRVVSTLIEVDLRVPDVFPSRTTIEFTASAGASTFVDFAGRELLRAELNGRSLEPADWADGRLPLTGLAAENTLVVEGVMAYGADGEGLNRHIDPADGRVYVTAMSFLDAAPRWFACFDQPDLKSSYEIDVRTPADWTVRGIGPAEQPSAGHWRISQALPISTYLVSIAAGPWASVTDEHDGIRLSLLARASMGEQLAAEADDIWKVTKACFDEYHSLFEQRYPFGEYHQVFAPDFNAGAMENPGCVILRDQLLFRGAPTRADRAGRAAVIAHEMAHQWFGDLVTMRWWDDLWLNESFAEYLGHRVCSQATQYELWTEFGATRKDWGAVVDQGPTTHPVAFNGARNAAEALANFDGISYSKGASLLRQLNATLGDEVFWDGLGAYFDAHRFGNAELADLIRAWQGAGAGDLDDFVTEWLAKPGMDLLVPEQRSGEWTLTRTSPAQYPANRRHTVECAELGPDGALLAEAEVVVDADRVVLPLDGAGVIVPNAGDQSWARIRASHGWDLPPISRIENPATRVILHNAIRDGVRHADLRSGEALRKLLTTLRDEPLESILRPALNFARELCGVWSPIGERASRRARLANLCRDLLVAAEPDSDRELVAAKALIAVSDDADLLQAWLAEGRLPKRQRRWDADVRWTLVTRLMVLGADPRLIGEELGRDPSAAGSDAAAGARAAIGTLAAKHAALERAMGDGGVRAYEAYAIGEQLFLPEQPELGRELVAPYFEALADLPSRRTGWALRLLVTRSFPATVVDEATLALADALLARDDLDATLRRALLEPVHQLRGALAAVALAKQAPEGP